MAISSTTNRWVYSGDGSTAVFAYTNKIFAKTDLKVYVDDVLKTVDTDYTVSGVGDAAGGGITFTTAPASTSASNVVIVREVPFTQSTSLPASGPFPSASVEDALDKATILAQQADAASDRSLKLSDADPATSIGAIPEVRANKFLGFDASGDPIASAGSADTVTVSTYMATVLDDVDAATARTTLGAPGLTIANTFTKQQQWAKGADIASAAALTLGTDGNYFDVTGTTTITSIGTVGVGAVIRLHFDGALTLTHHATDLVLPGGANITTAAGDEAEFVEYATGDWRCVDYTRAAQQPGNHVVQIAHTQTGAVATGTTVLPADDTIPQNTEGDEYLTVSITPKNANNILVVECVLNISSNIAGSVRLAAALFQDSTADALAVGHDHSNGADNANQLTLRHKMVAGTTNATTFKIRAGAAAAGTTTVNGSAGSRFYGGAMSSSLTVTEYAA